MFVSLHISCLVSSTCFFFFIRFKKHILHLKSRYGKIASAYNCLSFFLGMMYTLFSANSIFPVYQIFHEGGLFLHIFLSSTTNVQRSFVSNLAASTRSTIEGEDIFFFSFLILRRTLKTHYRVEIKTIIKLSYFGVIARAKQRTGFLKRKNEAACMYTRSVCKNIDRRLRKNGDGNILLLPLNKSFFSFIRYTWHVY